MYKRKMDDIENIKQIEIYSSSTKGAYFSLSSFLGVDRPYNALYINKGKIMLENLFETVTVFGKEYNIENITTISDVYTSKEYINEIDLDEMKYTLRCQNVTYTKRIGFIENSNVMVIEYDVKNENDERVKFGISPLITYRDQAHMKKASFLKFGSRTTENGLVVNLSITDNRNLHIVCNGAKYTKIEGYINNVKHEVNNLEQKKDVYIEDLYLPGKFEFYISKSSSKVIKFFVCDEKIDLVNDYNTQKVVFENEDPNFIELNKLKRSIEFMERANILALPSNFKVDSDFSNVSEKNYEIVLSNLLELIKSIDGRYICLDELDNAKEKIEEYIKYINDLPTYVTSSKMYYKCKFWLIEIINRLYLKDSSLIDKMLEEYICRAMSDVESITQSKEYEIVKNLEMVCLIYNVTKIYEEILKDIRYKNLSTDITEVVEKDFWDESLRTLKQNLDEMETVPSFEMIYSVCLSYSPLNNTIRIKVLDTIFRQLYTPFGIRESKKTSNQSLIYPKYMASFIKANLNQNGNTYSSKKIAYNLIKDLLMEIDKYVENNVKYVYSEKGTDIDYKAVDYFTTCEMIRLYSMFM